MLTLPFLFMIGYTGLTFFYSSYLPWPVQAAYGDADDAYARYEAELSPAQPAPPGILYPPRNYRTCSNCWHARRPSADSRRH